MAISFNPALTTNAANLFSASTSGMIQGEAMDDPAVRYALCQGTVDSAETLPMWGGLGIGEYVPAATADSSFGSTLKRALTNAALTGFTVFNQGFAGLTTPQSPVPLYPAGNSVNYYRFGSGARIPLQIDSALVSLDGGLVTQQVSWDFASQKIVKYVPTYSNVTITGATWASTAGGQTTFTVGTDLTSVLSAGATIDVTGVVSTGGTGVGYNGSFVVVSVTSTTIVVTQLSASSPGTYSSGGTVLAGGGALNARILEIITTGAKTVAYNSTTGFATYATNGALALVLI